MGEALCYENCKGIEGMTVMQDSVKDIDVSNELIFEERCSQRSLIEYHTVLVVTDVLPCWQPQTPSLWVTRLHVFFY